DGRGRRVEGRIQGRSPDLHVVARDASSVPSESPRPARYRGDHFNSLAPGCAWAPGARAGCRLSPPGRLATGATASILSSRGRLFTCASTTRNGGVRGPKISSFIK